MDDKKALCAYVILIVLNIVISGALIQSNINDARDDHAEIKDQLEDMRDNKGIFFNDLAGNATFIYEGQEYKIIEINETEEGKQ